jgi:hypothetical protein
MRKITACILIIILNACAQNDRKAESEPQSGIDAARDFVRAALDGNYKKARTYMLPDSVNQERMDAVERVNLSPEEKKGLAAASINIHDVDHINDSTTIVIYSNSYKNNWDTLRVVKDSGKWLVDFNYLFEHGMDSLMDLPPLKDTLQ